MSKKTVKLRCNCSRCKEKMKVIKTSDGKYIVQCLWCGAITDLPYPEEVMK